MKAYIDTRGPWPVYIKGMITRRLEGLNEKVTVEQAEILLSELDASNQTE